MNFGPKSMKLYHHLVLQDDFRGGANERHTRYRTTDGGNFRQSVGNVLCPPELPEHQENHGQGWSLERGVALRPEDGPVGETQKGDRSPS